MDDVLWLKTYRALFDALDEGIVFHDRDGRTVFANLAASRILGVSVETLLGQTSRDGNWSVLFESGRAARPEEHPSAVTRLSGQPQSNVVMRITRPDDRVAWVSVNTRPVLDPHDGDIDGVVISFADITVRHDTEERLRNSEARFQALLRHSSDVVIVTDATGVLSFVSESTRTMLGYETSEWLGRNGFALVHPDDVDQVSEALTNTSTTSGQAQPLEMRVRHADGSWRTVEVIANNLLDDPAVGGIVINVRDITHLRRVEDANAMNLRRFEALLTNLADVITVIDADGNMTYVSPNVEMLLGRRPEDRVGASIFDYVHPDDQGPALEKLAQGLSVPGRVERFESRVRHQDGTYRTWEVSATNRLDDPDVRGIIVNSRDVTDRVAAETALRHTEREQQRQATELERGRVEAQLAQAQRLESLGRLAGGVAHDFNNLLAVILNYAIFAAGQLDPASPLASDVAQIRRAAEQAAELTNKLLLFGRSDEHEPVITDLNTIVDNAVRLVQRSMKPDTRLLTQLGSRPCHVWMDPSQVEQALVNLILNANDALESGGTVTISTTVFNETGSDYASDGSRVVSLEVDDDGAGMSADVAERAFEPFFTTKARGDGSGLGLAIAHNVFARAGGTIEINSQLGTGTTIRVRLPAVAAPPQETKRAPRSRSQRGGDETVLIVDDDPHVLEIVRRTLSQHGYHVLVAETGTAAFAALSEHPEIALLLTDIVMPEMTGAELAERALALRPHLPIVYMTAYAHDHLTATTHDAVVVRKPFTPDQLLDNVRTELGRNNPG